MARQPTSWAGFLRLWLLLFFSYVVLKLLLDLSIAGYVDLRRVALVGDVALPFGQAVICWLVTRRARAERATQV